MNKFVSKKPVAAYLGPEGTFSHQASEKYFKKSATLLSCDSIPQVFESVCQGTAQFGVVPIENSSEGSIHLTLDAMLKEKQESEKSKKNALTVFGEVALPIVHNLIGVSGMRWDAVDEIYGHPQAFAQCREWLKSRARHVLTRSEAGSNAAAVLKISNQKNKAAIGPALMTELYPQYKILEKGIQDLSSNKTRFWVISKQKPLRGSSNKTSLVFFCHDKPGALLEVLKIFKKHEINLTKIESRPSRKKEWEYYFFVDFLGHEEDPPIRKALAALKKQTLYYWVLGSYPLSGKTGL